MLRLKKLGFLLFLVTLYYEDKTTAGSAHVRTCDHRWQIQHQTSVHRRWDTSSSRGAVGGRRCCWTDSISIMMAEKAKAEQALNEEEHELAEGRGAGRMLHGHHSIKF